MPYGALVCLQLIAASVHAQSSCVELSAELPRDVERCVTAEALCQSYQRALPANGGDDQPLVRQWRLQLRAATADSKALSLELAAIGDGRPIGQRTLSVRRSDCAALPDALALVLVLLAQEAAARPPPEPPAPAPPDPESPLPPAQPPARSGELSLGAGAGVAFGALPRAAFVLQLQAAVTREPISYRVRAALLWPQQRSVAEGTVLMRDYELAVEACPGVHIGSRPRFALRACAGPRLGLIYARADGFIFQNDRTTQFLLYFGVTPEVALALGSTSWLSLSAGAAVSLVRPRIAVAFGDGQSRTVLPGPSWLRGELMLGAVQIF